MTERACAIRGCRAPGRHALGVRCRRPDATALWAPNASVGLCDSHARYGVVLTLTVELDPDSTGVLLDVNGSPRFVPFSEAVSA